MRQASDVLDGLVPVAAGSADADVRTEPSRATRDRERVFSPGPDVRTRRFVFLVAALLVLVIVGMAQVWVRLRIVRMGYDLSAETSKARRLQRLEHKLEVEQALLRRPDRLENAAASRLGLREPRRGEVQEIRRGGSVSQGGL